MIRAETAVQIEQRVFAVAKDDSRVTPGNVLVVDIDVAVASPTDDGFFARDSVAASYGFLDPADIERLLFARLWLSLHFGRLTHGFLRELFIVETFEDGQQLCHLEQVFGSLRQFQKFNIASTASNRRVAGN